MASDPSIVAFIVEQIAAAGEVAARPMFGEYGVYCDGRMVALICDDRLSLSRPPAGARSRPATARRSRKQRPIRGRNPVW